MLEIFTKPEIQLSILDKIGASAIMYLILFIIAIIIAIFTSREEK